MKLQKIVGLSAGVVTVAVLVALDARDFSREPATDTADVVATWATVAAIATWLMLRRADSTKPSLQLVRAAAIGIAVSAVLIGLASVIYDPFAN